MQRPVPFVVATIFCKRDTKTQATYLGPVVPLKEDQNPRGMTVAGAMSCGMYPYSGKFKGTATEKKTWRSLKNTPTDSTVPVFVRHSRAVPPRHPARVLNTSNCPHGLCDNIVSPQSHKGGHFHRQPCQPPSVTQGAE